jgi:hypothetical protein
MIASMRSAVLTAVTCVHQPLLAADGVGIGDTAMTLKGFTSTAMGLVQIGDPPSRLASWGRKLC